MSPTIVARAYTADMLLSPMRYALLGALLCGAAVGCGGHPPTPTERYVVDAGGRTAPDAVAAAELCPPRRLAAPGVFAIDRPCGTPFAIVTEGARTVVLFGARRRFEEAAAPAVSHDAWVRVLPAPYAGDVDALERWLAQAARDPRPDVLAMGMQYLDGAPPILENGLRIAGDADYGPLDANGARQEGSDFNDYLGITWKYADGAIDRPETTQLHALDCSGYIRMIWGYRGGVPLAGGAVAGGEALARRAVQMDASKMGVVILANIEGQVPAALDGLQVGDLLFFDADAGDGPVVDHVGMFLGRDEGGHLRFLSSRKGANGPTLGDVKGASILDGGGLYARALRSARRL